MKAKTIFVVEGRKTEPEILNKITERFFDGDATIVTLPAGNTIYDVWNKMRKNKTYDLIEVLRKTAPEDLKPLFDGVEREENAETFLFFDLDIQSFHGKKNKPGYKARKKIRRIMRFFNNENEHGKLYLSYPMVESFYSWTEKSCKTGNDCFIEIKDVKNGKQYKKSARSSTKNRYVKIGQYTDEVFNMQMDNFLCRAACLFGMTTVLTRSDYMDRCKPSAVYGMEKRCLRKGKIFELSAFPEFLLDYFDKEFWDEHITPHEIIRDGCTLNQSLL